VGNDQMTTQLAGLGISDEEIDTGGGDEAGFVQPQPFLSDQLNVGRSAGGALAYYQREVTVTDRPSNPLEGFTEISRFVRVLNPLQKANEVAQAVNVYYGDNTTQRRLLEPGDTSEFMPLRSVDELWMRCKLGTGPADVVIEVFH
jgi:hypothetical protein